LVKKRIIRELFKPKKKGRLRIERERERKTKFRFSRWEKRGDKSGVKKREFPRKGDLALDRTSLPFRRNQTAMQRQKGQKQEGAIVGKKASPQEHRIGKKKGPT